jgi:hypothetical protein
MTFIAEVNCPLEPHMLTLEASVHHRAGLPPEELRASALGRYATA